MCGIVGLQGASFDAGIKKMNEIQYHRGPDDNGTYIDSEQNFAMANRRLAILDIEGGHQPMSTSDGRFTIVFNGEIYNAADLRRDLQRTDVKFKTDHSDTEVVLELYVHEGESMVKKLNGMFAFVIYDKKEKKLFCVRDHAGIKPFYYYHEGGNFAFASEMKSLLTLPFVKRELNQQSLFHYMSLMYVPGRETILKNIFRLPAGHTLTYTFADSRIQIEPFWTQQFSPVHNISRDEWVARIRAALEDALKRWTIADVSIGCSLSGGLDSSAIVGLLSQMGYPVKTYSLGFSGAGEAYWDETARARAVSQKWGTDHHELILNPEALLDDLLDMVWHLDEPYGGGLPSWTVFQFMSKDVKVGLTGTGGDELFGNYGKWRFLEPSWLNKFFVQNTEYEEKLGSEKEHMENFTKKFFEKFYYFSDSEKRGSVFAHSENFKNTADFLYGFYANAAGETQRDKIAITDLQTQLPEEFLMMTDRFSMAHSLEARTPFLDKALMELVFTIPSSMRTRKWNLKYLLCEAIADVMPRELLYARKKGFVIPLKLWLRGELRPIVKTLFHPDRIKKQGIFSTEFYTNYVLPHLDGKADYTNKVWAALMFQLWHHVYMERGNVSKPDYGWKEVV